MIAHAEKTLAAASNQRHQCVRNVEVRDFCIMTSVPQYQSFWPKNYNPREEANMPDLKLEPKTKPKKFVPKEYDEQAAIFDYARLKEKHDPRWKLLFGTLNGVRMSIGLAKKMKRAGMRAGVPDIWLPVRGKDRIIPTMLYSGLVIELKRKKGGHLDEDQKAYHAMLREECYRVVVCKGAEAAIKEIEEYLG